MPKNHLINITVSLLMLCAIGPAFGHPDFAKCDNSKAKHCLDIASRIIETDKSEKLTPVPQAQFTAHDLLYRIQALLKGKTAVNKLHIKSIQNAEPERSQFFLLVRDYQ